MTTYPLPEVVTEHPVDDVSDYIALLKPRVMSLVVFTSLCGMLLAPGHIHPIIGLTAILAVTVGAGASGCLNMWYDRDIDAIMQRTKTRPIPQGRISPETALAFGMILSCAAVLVMGVAVSWLCAALLAFTIVFYVVVYTMILKRTTVQNIVIGGVAGALPPVIGWAAVTNDVTSPAWVLFAIIFFWTPAHFWALSLKKADDYEKANVPMLPNVDGEAATKRQIVIYTILTVGISLVPYWMHTATLTYAFLAAALGVGFLVLVVKLWWDSQSRNAMQVFGYSILYLFLIFLGLTIDKLVLQ